MFALKWMPVSLVFNHSGVQAELGKEFSLKEAKICASGYHASPDFLGVMNWSGHGRILCAVKLSGEFDYPDNDHTKLCASKIEIIAVYDFSKDNKNPATWETRRTNPKYAKLKILESLQKRMNSRKKHAKLAKAAFYYFSAMKV